jgi:deoxyadenosine/deoxycytidine kinase
MTDRDSIAPDQAFIAVVGNIGAGKSTLASALASELGIPLLAEEIDNPYLPLFYAEPRLWAFHMQLFFIESALRAQPRAGQGAVQDRPAIEMFEVFTREHVAGGNMTTDEFRLIERWMQLAAATLRRPDLIVFADPPYDVLAKRIKARGRDYEQTIDRDYLRRLHDRYENFIEGAGVPVARVDTGIIDPRDEGEASTLADRVRALLRR